MPPAVLETASGVSTLSDEQMTFLRENGYLALDRISPPEEVREIRQILQQLFDTKAGHDQGAHFNFAGAEEDPNAPKLPQIVSPELFASHLKKTQFRENATALARQVLGPEARFHVDHTLMKPPGDGAATPWHQDEAFKDPRYIYKEMSVWMPLQPVNEMNGCMAFLPKSHLDDILPHRSPNNDPRVHALECFEGFDPADAAVCPLPAGGCTIHFGRTLHSAGPNRSSEPRYAYVLIFSVPPELGETGRSFSWLKNKDTARMRRTQTWLNNGGKYVKLWRDLKRMGISDYVRAVRRRSKRALAFFKKD